MSSPTGVAPVSESPVPGHLKALFELHRDAHTGIWYWRYAIIFSLAISYGFLVMSSHSPTMAFGGALGATIALGRGLPPNSETKRST